MCKTYFLLLFHSSISENYFKIFLIFFQKSLDNDKNYGIIKASRGTKDKENKKSSNFLHQND